MSEGLSRRGLLAAGAAAAAGATGTRVVGSEASSARGGKVRIIGVSCSPRSGKTTAAALKVCLEAAGKADGRIETELIELAGSGIGVFDPSDPAATRGGFARLIPVLSDAAVGGIVIGTPVYLGNMTSLCKAFLEHCIVFRKEGFALSGKAAGVLAVGGVRNGGQEMTIQSVQAALLCQEMVLVGDGRPTGHFGATLLNSGDSISGDEFGITTARNLGRRIGEVALKLA